MKRYSAIRFLSTPSARRATAHSSKEDSMAIISIHALREEGDFELFVNQKYLQHFYPRPPRGGRRSLTIRRAMTFLFLSTPSARRATVTRRVPLTLTLYFYPRPPRGGRRRARPESSGSTISIHALREEGDLLPLHQGLAERNFYPRPPRGGRQGDARQVCKRDLISIHALREEGDSKNRDKISIFL